MKNSELHNECFIHEIMGKVAERASKAAVAEYVKKEKAADKRVVDSCIHNTRELLKNYRRLMKADWKNREVLEKINEDADFSGLSWRGVSDKTHSSFVINSRMTHFSMERVHWAVRWFKEDCLRSGNPKDEVMYKVIYEVFLDMEIPIGEKVDYQQVADKHEIGKRTVYRYVDQAIHAIGNYLWGFNLIDTVGYKEKVL